MARKGFFRRAKRSSVRYAKRGFRSAKRSYASEGLVGQLLPAAIYGAVRAPAAKFASPLSSKLPLNGYEDEAVLALAGFLLHKYTPKGGLLAKVGKAAVIVESASVISQMTVGMTGSSNNSSGVVYG